MLAVIVEDSTVEELPASLDAIANALNTFLGLMLSDSVTV